MCLSLVVVVVSYYYNNNIIIIIIIYLYIININNNWLHEVEGMELAYLAIDSPLTASPVDRAQ